MWHSLFELKVATYYEQKAKGTFKVSFQQRLSTDFCSMVKYVRCSIVRNVTGSGGDVAAKGFI
jgi:hypothetical protein